MDYFDLKQYLNSARKVIKLNDIDFEICLVFAEYVYETNKIEYSRRKQFDKRMIIRQIVAGKLAELGVYEYLQCLGLNPEFPDFRIYGKNQKSFDADTKFVYQEHGINCHVKSQDISQGEIYSLSWLFQKHQDPLVKNPCKNDLLAFVRLSGTETKMLGFIWAAEATPCFSEPKIERLRGNKTALYLNDLKAAGLL